MAITLDGKIAREDGDVSFLDEYQSYEVNNIEGRKDNDGVVASSATNTYTAMALFEEYLSTVDVIIMGRTTFETVLGFGPDAWPYGSKRMVVMTRNPEYRIPAEALLARRQCDKIAAITDEGGSDNDDPVITKSSLSPGELLRELENNGFRHAYVDGGQTVRSFLKETLIGELTLTTIPRVLGRGAVKLFDDDNAGEEIVLAPIRTRVLPNGLVMTRYAVRA
jgi:dihydrofolate reductase